MIHSNSGYGIPNDESRKLSAAAWEDIMVGGDCDRSEIRSVIKNSWQRCLDYGVKQKIVSPTPDKLQFELNFGREKADDLLHALNELKEGLVPLLQETDSILLLTDETGVIIDMIGPEKILELANESQIVPGYSWEEKSSGTNAVGTAIELRKAVEIHACEHFCEVVHSWSCSAAPIFDGFDSKLIGVLNVSSNIKKYSASNISIAVSVAQQIEEIVKAGDVLKRDALQSWYEKEKKRWKNDGTILLDNRGRILSINDLALDSLTKGGTSPLFEKTARLLGSKSKKAPAEILDELSGADKLLSVETRSVTDDWQGGVVLVKTTSSYAVRETGPLSLAHDVKNDGDAFSNITLNSLVMEDLLVRSRRFARTSSPVLITGETGVGKEVLANAIHKYSEKSDGPFVAINCGALNGDLVLSELFGYEPGAFTGASPKGKIGKFEQAAGGTLFLDEVGELSLDVQVMLLRVLQSNIIVRISGMKERRIDARIIAATNLHLENEVEAGRFRRDLYYRLNVMCLHMPALSERSGDVESLTDRFLAEFAKTYSFRAKAVDAGLRNALNNYQWDGNVRELKSVLESMYVLSDDSILTIADLPEAVRSKLPKELESSEGDELGQLQISEKEVILREIEHQNGNLTGVAKALGVARSTLYRKLEELNISR